MQMDCLVKDAEQGEVSVSVAGWEVRVEDASVVEAPPLVVPYGSELAALSGRTDAWASFIKALGRGDRRNVTLWSWEGKTEGRVLLVVAKRVA
jgi:hypothetical protein